MRRFFSAVAVVALVAGAACSPQAAPKKAADHVADGALIEFRIVDPTNAANTIVGKYHMAPGKMRMEMDIPGAGPSTMILSGEDSYVIAAMGGQQMVMKVPAKDAMAKAGLPMPEIGKVNWQEEMRKTATEGGPCTAIGESGTLWKATDQTDQVESCVTRDGIPLVSRHKGVVMWEATKLTRGPQEAALFAPPPGAQVMDLGALMGPEMTEQLGQMLKDAQQQK